MDYDISQEIYHEDAVLEFPQSGERFVGRDAFMTWRRKYPADLKFKLRRMTGGGDFWVTENLISYDGSPFMFTLNILKFRGDKIANEYLYVMEGFAAATSGPSGRRDSIPWRRCRRPTGETALRSVSSSTSSCSPARS